MSIFDYYGNELAKAKDYAIHGYDFNSDLYYVVMKTCSETSSWSQDGKLARDILYMLKNKGWKQLAYVRNRNYKDEEYYAGQGSYIY